MRRKRKGWYDVTTLSVGWWWSFKTRKWMNGCNGNCSSHSNHMTAERAYKSACSLADKCKEDVYLTRWFYRKGKRYCKEYILRARQ